MILRRLAAAAVLAASALPAHALVASDPGAALLGAAGIIQKEVARSCLFGGLGVPPPCVVALPAPGTGKVMQVLSLSCEVLGPATAKVLEAALTAPNQPRLLMEMERVADRNGKTRFRSRGSQTLFAAAGAPAFLLDFAVVGQFQVTCGFVGQVFQP